MSRLNPLGGLDGYVSEVRAGFHALLTTLAAIGDLLAKRGNAPDAWEIHKRTLEERGEL